MRNASSEVPAWCSEAAVLQACYSALRRSCDAEHRAGMSEESSNQHFGRKSIKCVPGQKLSRSAAANWRCEVLGGVSHRRDVCAWRRLSQINGDQDIRVHGSIKSHRNVFVLGCMHCSNCA